MATDQLNFFIFEQNTAVQQKLRRFVTLYSVRADVDIRMDWAEKPKQLPYISRLVSDVHIALVSADAFPVSVAVGKAILDANPQCLVVFYGTRQQDLARYFPARPIAYLDQPEDPDVWVQTLSTLHCQIREDSQFFSWTSKFCRYYLPCGKIVSMHSSQGSLDIHMDGGSVYTITGRLDEAENRLPRQQFLRIHKSCIVNIRYIQAMDRSDKCLLLQNGTRAYISKVHYKDVTQFVEKMMTLQ